MTQKFIYTDYPSFQACLQSFKEEPFAAFQRKLIPGEKILGVRTPRLRAIAKQIAACDWQRFLADAQNDTMEEVILQGLVTGYAKMEYEESLKRAAAFAPKIKSWAACDICVSSFQFLKKDMNSSLAFIKPYLSSQKEFSVRFGVILLMDFFICDEYIDRLFPLFDSIRHDGYYARMAVAWAVSICFVKYPQKTARYLRRNRLDDWTYNKALQKIVESRRVDAETKQKIRAMKRKSKGKG